MTDARQKAKPTGKKLKRDEDEDHQLDVEIVEIEEDEEELPVVRNDILG